MASLLAQSSFKKPWKEKLEGLERVECQVDDVHVHGETQKIHHEWLQPILKHLTLPDLILLLPTTLSNGGGGQWTPY